MKLKFLLSTFIAASSLTSIAQDANKAYAITGKANGSFNWTDIREIDMATGKVVNTIYEEGKTPFSFTNNTLKVTATLSGDGPMTFTQNSLTLIANTISGGGPTQSMVAAAAYDSKHGKLFFAPMRSGELIWLDVTAKNQPKFYTEGQLLVNGLDANDEANNFTRMVIGADGNGYAITNDANHLVQFTTGKKIVITDLGNLVDDQSNKGMSVHNKCSSWGGDIIADAYGKLYLFTASHNVFKIDVDTRIATLLGTVTGLTGTYTVNGAAVDNSDNVVISSANSFEGFYKVNLKDLSATKLETTGQVFNASDLASSNLLYASEMKNTLGSAQLPKIEAIGNDMISVYPNPVTGTDFKVSFDRYASGTYNIILTDVQGRLIISKQVYVKVSSQIEPMHLAVKPAGGIYLIKVTDSNKKAVFSDKLVID